MPKVDSVITCGTVNYYVHVIIFKPQYYIPLLCPLAYGGIKYYGEDIIGDTFVNGIVSRSQTQSPEFHLELKMAPRIWIKATLMLLK